MKHLLSFNVEPALTLGKTAKEMIANLLEEGYIVTGVYAVKSQEKEYNIHIDKLVEYRDTVGNPKISYITIVDADLDGDELFGTGRELYSYYKVLEKRTPEVELVTSLTKDGVNAIL